MKTNNEVAVSSADDENCASGLIGSVLSLIISILVWLQEVGCKNVSKKNCPNTCDLNAALEKLAQFAIKADLGGNAHSKDCICPVHKRNLGDIKEETIKATEDKNELDKGGAKNNKGSKKDKNDKQQRRGKPDNYAVLYARTQDDDYGPDCMKCCKKFVQPTEKNEKDNVIFEVVAAEMAESETQTVAVELKDIFTQTELEFEEKQVETSISCVCTATQISRISIARPPVETEDKAIQVDSIDTGIRMMAREAAVDVETEDEEEEEDRGEGEEEDCECGPFSEPTVNITYRHEKAREDPSRRTKRSQKATKRSFDHEYDFDEYADETTDASESEEEYPVRNSRRCLPSSKTKQGSPHRRQSSSYNRSPPSSPSPQSQVRHERPQIYPSYEKPLYTTQYSPMYHDPYASARYTYPPQPYYQKITRTIHRGPARKAEYEVVPQTRMSPTQHSRYNPDCQSECKGVEKFVQSEPTPPPAQPQMTRAMSPKTSKNECLPVCPGYEREMPVSEKECVSICPGNKIHSAQTRNATPQSVAPPPPLHPPESSVAPIVIKECDVRCSKTERPERSERMERSSRASKPETPLSEKPEEKKVIPKKCAARCSNKNSNKNTGQSQPVAYMPKGAIPIDPRDVQSLEVEEAPSKKALMADSYMAVEPSKKKK